jgi:hypothetical protein
MKRSKILEKEEIEEIMYGTGGKDFQNQKYRGL